MTKVTCKTKSVSGRWTRWFAASILLTGAAALATGAGDLRVHAADAPLDEQTLWQTSAHADATAEAFNHWNNSNPPQVSTSCAKCHSTPGYQDYLGADGSPAGVVDKPAPIGTVIDCTACHNDAATALKSVTFPSAVEVNDLGPEARCMVCHQGRESKMSVDTAIATKADPNHPDTASTSLGFVNVHYRAAAATLYGGVAKGGYQYDGKSYDVKFTHAQDLDTCIDCHNQHSLEVRIEKCVVCHTGVQTKEDFKKIRMNGSAPDYDGDGNVAEGIAGEIEGLQEILYKAIQAYATQTGAPIIYDSNTSPYFFKDSDGNGQVDPNENASANKYASWTPRLLKAGYNYQFSLKDPGAFAHNAKYVIQLLFDSIADIDPNLVTKLTRNDAGHFAGSDEQWRHWDTGTTVSASCSKCHSASGLPSYIQTGVTSAQPLSNGLMCSTCHDAMPAFTRYQVPTVKFPSGASLDTGNRDSNLCISCHQGRESTVSVNTKIAGLDIDTVSTKLSFTNVHYFAAGATLFGTQAKGMYEYAGKTYQGRVSHVSSVDTCTECHDVHTGDVKTQSCANPYCHGTSNPQNIRKSSKDYDGDGNKTEGLSYEVAGMADILYAAIRSYATTVAKSPIVYDSTTSPYFFIDTNANGVADANEVTSANKYVSWTPRLLCAAYNYQYFQKEPGAFAHNGKYILQVLYDSIADLSTKVTVDMTRMNRP